MSKVIELNIDVDNVIADWVRYVTTVHYPGLTQEQLNKHENRVGMLTQMYRVDPHLFNKLDRMEGATELVAFLQRIHQTTLHEHLINVRFLTATDTIHPNFYQVAYDKQQWLAREFDIPPTQLIVVRTSIEKTHYAHPMAILVDDYDKNIRDFTLSGGHGVFVAENYCPHRLIDEVLDKLNTVINHPNQ